jgi:hypothetical protein
MTRSQSHPHADLLHAREEDVPRFTSNDQDQIPALAGSSIQSSDDTARQIIDAFLGLTPSSSGDLIWAIRKSPEYLRRRLCPDCYEILFSALVTGNDILFSISILFAIVITLPDQGEQIADVLMKILLPLLRSDQEEIYEGAARLASHLLGYANNIEGAIMECMPALIAFNGDLLMNGDYDDKVSTWHFFRSLSAITHEEFFDLIPDEILSELLESLLDRDDAEHVHELIKREYGGDDISKANWERDRE